MPNFLQKLYNFYNDPQYYRQMIHIAAPIILQNLLMSSLNMVSSLLIGQLGDESVAAVGLAGQIFFLLNLMLFGIMSGAAILTAQLWGKGDLENVRRVLGFAIKFGLLAGIAFWTISTFTPAAVMRFYTTDETVIQLASQYLQIYSWGFPFFAITFAYAIIMRTTGEVKIPLLVSVIALAINTTLAWALIFGNLGAPTLGILGAAWAGLIARIIELILILVMVYRNPQTPTAVQARHLLDFDPTFIAAVLKPILPVFFNELLWSLGITTYSAIYAHIGTESFAAINIVQPIDQMAFVAFLGIGNATAITVGNLIGRGEMQTAYRYAGRSLGLQIAGGILVGITVWLLAKPILGLYNVSPLVTQNAQNIIAILSAGMWIRASNHVIIIGILRAGGDTRFSLILDGFVIWLVGVPLAAAGAFLLHLPVQYVYALALSEEATKFIFGVHRYFSRKWINNLTSVVEG
jgi:putative MATE family efflux protein